MDAYVLLVLVLVGLSTLAFWVMGMKCSTAFLVAAILVSLSACIAMSYSLFARWIVGAN